MKRITVAGLGTLGALAACAAMAASASAEAPEFGRCVKQPGGGFSNAACTRASRGKAGRFEWYPGAAKAHFTTKSKPGMTIVFEGVHGTKVTCAEETSSGEFTSPKLEEHIVFKFTGCEAMGQLVNSPGAPWGEVVTNPTECELGVLMKGATPAMNKIGLTCAEEPAFMWMKWGSVFDGSAVEWCLRGWWFFTLKANRMQSTVRLKSREAGGVQYWEKFEGGPPEPLEATSDEGKTWERAGLSLTSTQTNEEPIEVNSVA